MNLRCVFLGKTLVFLGNFEEKDFWRSSNNTLNSLRSCLMNSVTNLNVSTVFIWGAAYEGEGIKNKPLGLVTLKSFYLLLFYCTLSRCAIFSLTVFSNRYNSKGYYTVKENITHPQGLFIVWSDFEIFCGLSNEYASNKIIVSSPVFTTCNLKKYDVYDKY